MRYKIASIELTAFEIKLIAVVAMLLDHAQLAFPEVFPLWFRVIGRMAFPLFVFLIAEGFRHTRSDWKFLVRLAVFAFISEPFFDFVSGNAAGWGEVNFLHRTNIFYTLFLGGAAIAVHKLALKRWNITAVGTVAVIVFALAATVLTVDYGWVGVVFIYALYRVKEPGRIMVLGAMCFLLWLPLFLMALDGFVFVAYDLAFVVVTFLSLPIAARYNGKRGRSWKWFFYGFYPVHLAFLSLLLLVFQ